MAPLTATLPHPPPDADAPGLRIPAAPLRAVAGEGEQAPLVLIAEDHEDSRDALQTLFDALGYRVAVAVNGAQAVTEARARRPDLILMDMMMPEVDGFQATRTLRADAAFDGVPILAVTAMEGAREAVLQAGADDVVTKPIDIRSFLVKVRAWLASGRAVA